MDFVVAKEFITFFECYRFDSILEKFNLLIHFCYTNIQKSKLCEVKRELFEQKYLNIKENLIKNKFYNFHLNHIFENLEQDISQLEKILILPLGRCHGDLTLSNVLFLENKIVLIDFLDSFIETPLQDIVKLRQDTKHKWSLNLYKNSYDKTKINIILDILDKKVEQYLKTFDFYKSYYTFFQKINLFRIMPYVKNKKIMSYLIKEILKLKNEEEQ